MTSLPPCWRAKTKLFHCFSPPTWLPWKPSIRTAGCNKRFQSLVFVLTPLNFGQAWLPARIFTFFKTTAHDCESGLLGLHCLHCRSNFGDLYFRHSSNGPVEFANFRNKRRFRWRPVYRLFLYVTLTRHRYPLKALFIFQLFSSGYPIEHTQIVVRHHIAYFQLNLCGVCYYVLSKVRPGCQVFQAIEC